MAALQCEICGGKLIGKPGGVFECDSCGMEYSTEWAKAKIQEIRGTVQVEGTVEVTGTVKVEGGANKESLLKRGYLLLEDSDWKGADECFDQVLNMDPECAEAYVGKLCVERRCRSEAELGKSQRTLVDSGYYQKVLRFGGPELRVRLEGYDRAVRAQLEAAAQANRKKINDLASARAALSGVSGVIVTKGDSILGLRADGTVLSAGSDILNDSFSDFLDTRFDVSGWSGITAISCGGNFAIGLRADGTVVATGWNLDGECNVTKWTDIASIACSSYCTVGLKKDGTVVATGSNSYCQCEVTDWKNITAISCGTDTFGLRTNGTVAVTKRNKYEESEIENWKNIVSVVGGTTHTVGLRADGTVVAAEMDHDDQREVSNWSDIVMVSCSDDRTVGLRADGTVVAVGYDLWRPALKNSFSGWKNIVSIAASDSYLMGLKSDGTVLAVKWDEDEAVQMDLSNWTEIVAISCDCYLVGLKADGTVVTAGNTGEGQCDVSSWKLFGSLDTLEQEREEARERWLEKQRRRQEEQHRQQEEARRIQEEQRAQRRAALEAERTALQNELANLKGLFSGKRRKEIEARLAAIAKELEE